MPLSGSEALGDLVLMQTLLLLIYMQILWLFNILTSFWSLSPGGGGGGIDMCVPKGHGFFSRFVHK